MSNSRTLRDAHKKLINPETISQKVDFLPQQAGGAVDDLLFQKNQQLVRELQTLKITLKQKQEQIEELAQSKGNIQSQLASKQQDIDELTEQISELKRQIKDHSNDSSHLGPEIDSASKASTADHELDGDHYLFAGILFNQDNTHPSEWISKDLHQDQDQESSLENPAPKELFKAKPAATQTTGSGNTANDVDSGIEPLARTRKKKPCVVLQELILDDNAIASENVFAATLEK